MLNELSVKDFVLQTASDAPVPGGGSISALCGTLSSALAKMVAKRRMVFILSGAERYRKKVIATNTR